MSVRTLAIASAVVGAGACLLTLDDGRLAAIEAALDGGTNDGEPRGGGGDAGVQEPYCATSDASLCVDFDREPLGSRWTEVPTVSATRVFELTDASYTSAPFAARLGVLRQGTGEPFFHDLVWDREGAPNHLRVETRVNLQELDATCVGLVRIVLGKNRLDVPIGTSQNGCMAQEDAPDSFQDIQVTGATALSRWTKVVIDLDLSKPRVQAWFDDVPVVAHDLGASWRPESDPRRSISVRLGLLYVAPPVGPEIILLDDVRIDAP